MLRFRQTFGEQATAWAAREWRSYGLLTPNNERIEWDILYRVWAICHYAFVNEDVNLWFALPKFRDQGENVYADWHVTLTFRDVVQIPDDPFYNLKRITFSYNGIIIEKEKVIYQFDYDRTKPLKYILRNVMGFKLMLMERNTVYDSYGSVAGDFLAFRLRWALTYILMSQDGNVTIQVVRGTEKVVDPTTVPASKENADTESDAKKAKEEEEMRIPVDVADFPEEIVDIIAKGSVKMLLVLAAQGDRRFVSMANDPRVWRALFARDFPADYGYWQGQVPLLISNEMYTQYMRPWDYKDYNDNEWKKLYLWTRRIYKTATYFTTADVSDERLELFLENPKFRERHFNQSRFADAHIDVFFYSIIRHVLYQVIGIQQTRDHPEFDLFTLFKVTLNVGWPQIIQAHSQYLNEAPDLYNPSGDNEPGFNFVLLYDKLVTGRENGFLNALLRIILFDRERRVSTFDFEVYRAAYDDLLDNRDDYGFFNTISRMWSHRISLLYVPHDVLVVQLLYGDQIELRHLLQLLPAHPQFFNQNWSWLRLANAAFPAQFTKEQWIRLFVYKPRTIALPQLAAATVVSLNGDLKKYAHAPRKTASPHKLILSAMDK